MQVLLVVQSMLCLGCCACTVLAQTNAGSAPATGNIPLTVSTPGLMVGSPKVYDTFYLQRQLDSLKAQLEAIQAVSGSTLTSHIGNVQGADLQQVGGAVQISGPSAAAITSVTGATPSTTSTGSSLAGSNPQVTASTLAMPTPAQSSLDTLNESMQLAAEINALKVLLDGALNDKLDPKTGKPRSVYTIGFPITFSSPEPATAKTVRDAAAQIQVTICRAGDSVDLMTLLPQERTYNVAGLVDHSFAGSAGGVLSGVLSVGGGFFWSHKRYDVVQQQETIALLRKAGSCGKDTSMNASAAFVWQIYPVLGNRYVRQGTQQNIVQFSLPSDGAMQPGSSLVKACVSIAWTKTRQKGTILDPFNSEESNCFDVPYFNTKPELQNVHLVNTGGANLLVTARGTFLPGSTVRVGPNVLLPSAVSISPDATVLTFRTTGEDLVNAGGASLWSREGDERSLGNAAGAPGSTPLRIDGISLAPYTDTLDLLTIKYTPPTNTGIAEPCAPIAGQPPDPGCMPSDPHIVTVGSKIYGLGDGPFLRSDPNVNEIKVLVAPSLIVEGSKITMQRLLWSKRNYYAEFYPSTQAVSISKLVPVSSDPGLHLAVVGANLTSAILKFPENCAGCFVPSTPNFGLLNIGPKQSEKLKQLIFCRSVDRTSCDAAYPASIVEIPKKDGAAKQPKVTLKKGATAALKAQAVSISGTDLEQIVAVTVGKTDIAFRLSATEPSELILDLPASISARAGNYTLSVHLADRTIQPYTLKIQAK